MKKQSFKWPKKSTLALAVLASFQLHANENNHQYDSKNVQEEILVIGKFQQSLINRISIDPQELPFTLNILDRDFLDARNFTRPIEALTTLPNITRTEDRLGIGTAGFLSRGFEAPVLVDNRIQNNFRGSGARDDSFVERYEVLKGPASISLGPIGPGGVINTVTKVPQADEFYDVELRVDQFGSVGAEFDVNFGDSFGSDNVLLRLSGAYRDFEFDASETQRKTVAVRPVLTADITAETSIRASLSYTQNTVNPNSGFPLLSTGEIPSQIDTDTFTGYANGEGVSDDALYEAEISHQLLDNLKLTIRGSHQETDFDYQNTSGLYNYNYSDGTPGLGLNDPYVYTYANAAETESRVTFYDALLSYQVELWGQTQDFVVGIAYDNRSFDRLFSPFQVQTFRIDELDDARFGPEEFGALSPFTKFNLKLSSVFAETAIRPNEWLTINAGLRYDSLDQVTTNFRRGRELVSEFDDSEVTIRLGASAKVVDDINLYLSYSEAFVPQFGLRQDNGEVAAETSNGFELGAKGSTLNGVLSFEAGFFFSTRENVAVRDSVNSTPEIAFVTTIGELEVKGFEFSSTVNPVEGLDINLNLGLNDIDITKAGDKEVSAAVFPEQTGSVYISYELQSGSLEGLKLGTGFRYVGERAGPVVDFDSYTIADFNLSYPIKEGMTISLDILNINDEEYIENSASFAQNINGGSVLGAPRTAVLTFNSRF
ncbi:MAG: TonB-dependent receptor [Arenicella sp.]|nr:TonB-dependent receptor [Arenicella sp.]